MKKAPLLQERVQLVEDQLLTTIGKKYHPSHFLLHVQSILGHFEFKKG